MRLALFAASLVLLAACSKSPAATAPVPESQQPAIADVATSFHSYKLMTPEPVLLNSELAMLCRGVYQADIDAAQKTKGPHAFTAILIYMNEAAARSFVGRARPYETGAIIIKEKKRDWSVYIPN